MKKIIYLLFIVKFFCSCKNQKSDLFITADLLDRSEKIQYFNEWAEVRSRYADLKHLLKKDPTKVDALIQLTNLYISEARITGEHGYYYPSAFRCIEQALKQKKLTKDQKFLVLSAKASVELSLHHFSDGLKTAQEAVELNPYNAQIYGALVDAYVEMGQYDKAVLAADKMVSIRPDLRSYSRVSYLREIYGKPEEAIQAMQMAVEAGSPGSEEKSWAALQLAQLLSRYNKTNEAQSVLTQLLSERPDYPFGKSALASIYMKQDKWPEAERELQEACAIIPEVGFYIHLAELYKKTNQSDKMNQKIMEILEMMKDDEQHGHNMSLEYAMVYSDLLNKPDEALKHIQRDLLMRPENIDVNLRLAKIYLLKNDKLKAQAYLQKAEITNSKNPELLQLRIEINGDLSYIN